MAPPRENRSRPVATPSAKPSTVTAANANQILRHTNRALVHFCNKYVTIGYAKSLLFDPARLNVVAWFILLAELVLNVGIVGRVPYTEIDWRAYMQECEGFLNGTTDYSQLRAAASKPTIDFTGKVVLITGASSGIGAGTACYFATLGAKLALTGRNAENLHRTAVECLAAGAPAEPFEILGDLTVSDNARRIVDTVVAHFGRLDVLINNAGILERRTLATGSLEVFDAVMDVNIRCMYEMTRLAMPHLVATRGNVVNLSSVSGIRASTGAMAYSISKTAVAQFTQCAALELADRGVRVNAVAPGVIVTDIHKRSGMNDAHYEAFLEHSKTTHALGRNGRVEDVARVIGFLANNEMAAFVTGVLIPVDGGRQLMGPAFKFVL